MRFPLKLFLAVLLAYALFAQGTVRSWDGATMLAVTRSMVLHSSLEVPPTCPGKYAADGRYYGYYGVGQSLAAIPLFAAGQLGANLVDDNRLSDDVITEFVISLFNPIITALTCVVLYLVALEVGLAAPVAAACALLYGFATGAFVQMKDFNSEPLTALLLLVGVYSLLGLRKSPSAGRAAVVGLCVGAAIAVRLAAIVAVPVLAGGLLWIALQQGGGTRAVKWLAAFAAPVALGIAGVGLYNYVRFGDVLETGYWQVTFQYPFFAGLNIQLVAARSGLLWYNPVVILAPVGAWLAWRRSRFAAGLFGLMFLVHLLLYSVYDTPAGGHSVGNRFLLVTMPYLIIWVGFLSQSLGTRRWRTAIWALVALSVLIQLPLVYINPSYYFARLTSQHQREQEQDSERFAREVGKRSRRWRDSLLVQSWVIAAEVSHNVLYRGEWLRSLEERTQPGDDATALLATRSFRVPYLWWVLAYYYGAPRWVIGLVLALLLAANVVSITALRQGWPRLGA